MGGEMGPLERGDILDGARLSAVIESHKPEIVMHFAACAYGGESVVEPAKYYWNNLVGMLALLDAMRIRQIDHLVFSSSCTVYGLPRTQTIDESHERLPISPYGMSKFAVERCIEDYCRAYGMKSVILRYFSAAGADPDGEIGEDHQPETHLIPIILEAAQVRRPYLSVFGTDYDTSDRTCVRDFGHVSDIADAHVAATGLLEQDLGFIAINLESSVGHSVKEVIAAVTRVCGCDIPVRLEGRRVGDLSNLVASNEIARRELGWVPSRSAIDTVLETAWKWANRTQ